MQKTIFNILLRSYTYQHLLLYMTSCKGMMIFTKCSKASKTVFEDFKIEIFFMSWNFGRTCFGEYQQNLKEKNGRTWSQYILYTFEDLKNKLK